jgi:hypothetical protein
MKTLLIINDQNSIDKINQIVSKNSSNWLVASDDLNIHNNFKVNKVQREIIYLERTISLFDVSGDVIRITDEINQWFNGYRHFYDKWTDELIYFLRHVEGGKTTQRIQDICILVSSYKAVLIENSITNIELVGKVSNPFETSVLLHVAKHLDIPVEHGNYPSNMLIIRMNKIKDNLFDYLYLIRDITNLVLRKLTIGISKDRSTYSIHKPDDVAIQLCGDGKKHYGHIYPLMESFVSIGLHPTLITWNAPDSAQKFQRAKYSVIEMEKYISMKSIIVGFMSVISLLKKTWLTKKTFKHDRPVYFQGLNINDLLWPSIIHLVTAKLFARIMQKKSLIYIMTNHRYKLIKPWGAQALAEGRIFVNEAKRHSDPILISYEHGIAAISPYFDNLNIKTYQFLNGDIEKNIYLNSYKMSPNYLIPVGQVRYTALKEFIRRYSKEDSKDVLGVGPEIDYIIAFDFPIFSRGSQSFIELMSLVELIKAIALRSDVCILLKPHPGSDSNTIKDLFPQHGSLAVKNMIIIDKEELPYHTLNACDVFITKYSAVGIEAMMFKKILVSMLYDNQEKRKLYGDGATYFLNNHEVISYFDRILSKNSFNEENDKSKKVQSKFLKDYFHQTDLPVSDLIAKHCQSLINNHSKMF